jgi:hypothetical protein
MKFQFHALLVNAKGIISHHQVWQATEQGESKGIACQQNSHWTLDVTYHLTLPFPSGHFRIRYYRKSIATLSG